jgi:hypothetical protein
MSVDDVYKSSSSSSQQDDAYKTSPGAYNDDLTKYRTGQYKPGEWRENYDRNGNREWDDITGTEWNKTLQNPGYRHDLLTSFDDSYYRQANPDVDAAIKSGQCRSAFDHFITNGAKEGRKPDQYFEESYYLNTNPDVRNAVATGNCNSGFEHFIKFGSKEGRNPCASFDSKFYLQHNPDVAKAVNQGQFSSPFQHYTAFGQFEGRDCVPPVG